jgi:uncharacterized membrane protein YvlD (DUF360 family)
MFKDLWNKFDKIALWESVKLPIRLLVLGVFSFVLSQISIFLAQKFGFTLNDGTKEQITVWFTGSLETILVTWDKYIHESRASTSEEPLEGFSRGLLPF